MDLKDQAPSPGVEATKCLVCDAYHSRLRPIRIGNPEQGFVHPAHEEPAPAEHIVECPLGPYLLAQASLPLAADGGEPVVIPIQEVLGFMLWLMYTSNIDVLDVYTFESEDSDELVGSHPIVRGMRYLLEAIAVQLGEFFGQFRKLDAEDALTEVDV